MTESAAIAAHIAGARYDDLPPSAVDMAKLSLLDALGVSLAASGLCPECLPFVEIARESGGAPESTILGFGTRVPAHLAALANGAMAHALDFEDAHDQALTHPNAATVPVALAVAEAVGPVGGKEFIIALALGCDLVCRLGLALNENPGRYGWYIPPILGAFGAAAAVKLSGLNQAEVLDALSLTLCQATCSAELKYSPNSDVRSVRDAFAAQAGLLAARLAGKGIRGFDQPLEGRAGLYSLYARGDYDRAKLTRALGREFEGSNVSIKPWPSCRGTHAYIEAALEIRKEQALRPGEIAEVKTVVNSLNLMLCQPEESKQAPQKAIDAKFSIPFTVATALHYGQVGLEHFESDKLTDKNVLALARKVRHELDPELGFTEATRGVVEITTENGDIFTRRIDQAYGHPDKPVAPAAVSAKFMTCAGLAQKDIPEKHLKEAIEFIMTLEDQPNVGRVTEWL